MLKFSKSQQTGVATFLVFAVMILVGIRVFSSFDTVASSLASTTSAAAARNNVTTNTYSGFNLVSVGPIIFGAVIILGIVAMLYMRK